MATCAVVMFQWHVGGNAALIAQNMAAIFPDVQVGQGFTVVSVAVKYMLKHM